MDLNNLLSKITNKIKGTDGSSTANISKISKGKINLGDELLWTSGFVIAVLGCLLFGYLLKFNFFESRALSQLKQQSEDLALSVQQSTEDVKRLAADIIANNPNAENIVELIQNEVDNTLRVLRILEPLDDIQPDTVFPGINFATLDMLKVTSKTQQEQMPEIHLYGQSNQYLNFVYIQKPKHAYVVVSYPIELIIKPQHLQFDKSELVLTQQSGSYSNVELQKWGEVDQNATTSYKQTSVPNSNFFVTYAVEKNYSGLFNLSLLSSIVAFLSALMLAILTYIKRQQRIEQLQAQKDIQEEEPVYVHTPNHKATDAVADLEDNQPKSNKRLASINIQIKGMMINNKGVGKLYLN